MNESYMYDTIGHDGIVECLARRVDIAFTRRRGCLPASSLWRLLSSGTQVPVNEFLFSTVGYLRCNPAWELEPEPEDEATHDTLGMRRLQAAVHV
jgi:hypothetical protein